jgi:hypothetical protein
MFVVSDAGEGTAFGVLCIINMVLFGLGGAASIILMGRSYGEFRGKPKVVASRGAPATGAARWV